MSSVELSKTIVSATNFLSSVHTDIKALIASMDQFMDGRGWQPVWRGNNPLTYNLGNTLAKEWVARELWLYFLPKGSSKEDVHRLITCGIHLTPPAGAAHDFAAMLAISVRLKGGQSLGAIEKSWKSSEAKVYEASLGKTGPVILGRDVFEGMNPAAMFAFSSARPLCDLRSTQEVTEFLTPLLDAEARFANVKFPVSRPSREELERIRAEAHAHPERGKSLAEFLAKLERGEVPL